MYGRVDETDDRDQPTGGRTAGRHRNQRPMPAPLALGLSVTVLLTAFGIGAAVLPGSVTGSGSSGEAPAAYATQPPGGVAAGTGVDSLPLGGTATDNAAAADASPSPQVTTTPAKKAKPKPKPKVTTAKPKPSDKTTKVGAGQAAQENEVIRLTNVERLKQGCGKVVLNTELRTAMRAHTQDMATNNYFSHDSQDGRSPWDRAKAAGYLSPIGENIAKGQRDAADVMHSWMNSPGHKANILNCDAKAIGVGLSYDGGTAIWGQLFGSV